MKYLILDVDTGIDDALAIAMACGKEDTEIIGITTAFGNTCLDYATRNTLDVLCELGHGDTAVYSGASSPWGSDDWPVSDHLKVIHGNNGVGNVEFTHNPEKTQEIKAWDFMIRASLRYREKLTIVCLGPLTNLANAIKKDREAMSQCGKIAIMGGALTIRGNITPYAEANIYNDPKAADFVFRSGLDLTVIGLDVTLKTIIMGEDIAFLKEMNTARSRRFYDMAYYYYANETGVIGGAMHDPLAVEVALNPDIITRWHDIKLTVEQEGLARGRIMTTGDLLVQKDKNVHYALDVDSRKFMELFVGYLANAMKEISILKP